MTKPIPLPEHKRMINGNKRKTLFDRPRSRAMKDFILREKSYGRVLAVTIALHDIRIYTDPNKWHDGFGGNVFTGVSEKDAMRNFKKNCFKREP